MGIDTSKKIENKKWRNTALLFELLVRQITADTLSGADTAAGVSIMKKYFNKNTEMGKELQLYKALIEKTNLSEIKALNYIDLVLEQRYKLDEKKLAEEKYELINEIKQNYNLQDFLSYKINNYVLCASIYKTFMTEVYKNANKDIMNISDIATARFTLIEHLCSASKREQNKQNSTLQEFLNQPEDVRLIAYGKLIDKFNNKYTELNTNQKALLREYINSMSNKSLLVEYVKKVVPELKNDLLSKLVNVENRATQIKINEIASQIEKIGQKTKIKDNDITALILAFEIAKEMVE